MNRKEAAHACIDGAKIGHENFGDWFVIFREGGFVISHIFYKGRKDPDSFPYEDGYYIFEEKPEPRYAKTIEEALRAKELKFNHKELSGGLDDSGAHLVIRRAAFWRMEEYCFISCALRDGYKVEILSDD